MTNKHITPYLILGAFVSGFIIFWLFNSLSMPTNNYPDNTRTGDSITDADDTTPEYQVTPTVPSTKSLDLSGQGLNKLPSYVLARTDLEELDISDNKLTGALPSEIGKLRNLKVLKASHNLMTGVPAEIGHLPDLEILDLSDNQLTGLPNELAQLKKLKVLNFSGNDYSEHDLDIIRAGLSEDVKIIL